MFIYLFFKFWFCLCHDYYNDTCDLCLCFLCVKVEKRIDLVYGGGSVGLMGLVSQAVHDGGRHVLGLVCFYILYVIILLFRFIE